MLKQFKTVKYKAIAKPLEDHYNEANLDKKVKRFADVIKAALSPQCFKDFVRPWSSAWYTGAHTPVQLQRTILHLCIYLITWNFGDRLI